MKEYFDVNDPVVNFEIAELAHDRGFNYRCEPLYTVKDKMQHRYMAHWISGDTYLAPTLYKLQRWLREVHKIEIVITVGCFDNTYHSFISNYGYIYVHHEENCMWEFKTYEEALESALIIGLNQIKS